MSESIQNLKSKCNHLKDSPTFCDGDDMVINISECLLLLSLSMLAHDIHIFYVPSGQTH